MFYAVIMAGGQGTRLWPMSRKKMPKQLQRLASEKSLIEETVERLSPLLSPKEIIISTTPEYKEAIQKQLPQIPKENFIIEPFANGNTAACTLVTMMIQKRDPKAVLAFLPADHAISQKEKFVQTLRQGRDLAVKKPDYIITIGIEPTRPDTGLGYIHRGSKLSTSHAFVVERFVEKPNLERAEEFLKSGEYLWNAGIFIWTAEHFLNLVKKFLPQTHTVLKNTVEDKNFKKRLFEDYGKTENISIDFGIMEKTKEILVIPANFNWSDIGNWGTLYELLAKMQDSSVVSRGHHLSTNDDNILVFAGDKLVATVGLKDIVIIDTEDALLICNRHRAHEVKDLLNKLKDEGKEEYL